MRRLLGDDDDEDDCAFPAVPLSRMKSFLCWLTLQMCGYERSAHSHDVVLWGVKTGGTWKCSCIVKEMYHTLCTFCNNSRADNVTRTVMMVTNYFSVWDFLFFFNADLESSGIYCGFLSVLEWGRLCLEFMFCITQPAVLSSSRFPPPT